MSFEELKKCLVQDYFVIVTGTLIGTLVYCLIFERSTTFSLFYLGWVLIFSLLADLPLCIFYSRKELTEHQWMIRFILHFITLEGLLLTLAYFANMYHNLIGGVVFALIVAGVYVMVRYIGHQINIQVALKMNEHLKRMQENEH